MGVQHKQIKRNQYSSEFKREAVRLVNEGGLSIAQVPAKGIRKTKNWHG